MKILKLEVSGFKRIRAAEITPKGDLVEITGKNAQGKSSILDAIMAAMGGTRRAPESPVRKGYDKAQIVVELGDITVERTFTKQGGAALVVRGKDGVKLGSPQAVLDKLYGDLTFDPLHFSLAEPREQVRILKNLTGLEETFAALDAKKAELLQAKAITASDRKRLEAQAQGLSGVDEGPTEPVDIGALSQEMVESATLENEIARATTWIRTQETKCESLQRELDQITKTLRAAQEDLASGRTGLERMAAARKRTAQEIQATMMTANAENDIRMKRRAKAECLAATADVLGKAKKIERALEGLDADRQNALETAKFPIKGLGFTEDGVTLEGVPFAQASSAQRIRASVAIGAALAPELKVVLVREGSLLDTESMKQLATAAADMKLQVWVERVTDGQGVGVVIEDGEVATVAPTSVEQAGGVA